MHSNRQATGQTSRTTATATANLFFTNFHFPSSPPFGSVPQVLPLGALSHNSVPEDPGLERAIARLEQVPKEASRRGLLALWLPRP